MPIKTIINRRKELLLLETELNTYWLAVKDDKWHLYMQNISPESWMCSFTSYISAVETLGDEESILIMLYNKLRNNRSNVSGNTIVRGALKLAKRILFKKAIADEYNRHHLFSAFESD